METLLKAVVDFAREMQAKGYENTFQTNGAYPDTLKESLLKYIEAAALGDEPALNKGVGLSTYLKRNGSNEEYITAWMSIRLLGDRFSVDKMSITCGNKYGKTKEIDIGLAGKPVPTKKEAIYMVMPPVQKDMRRNRRFKI